MTRYERCYLGMTAMALIVSVVGFALVYGQLHSANKSLRTGVYTNMSVWTFEIDKVFIQNPELRPYFFEGKELSETDQNFAKAESVSEYLLGNFDSMLEFRPFFPDGAPHEGWINWMYDSFDRSPVLRHYIEKRRRWYEPGQVWGLYDKWKRDHAIPEAAKTEQRSEVASDN